MKTKPAEYLEQFETILLIADNMSKSQKLEAEIFVFFSL